MTNDSTIDTTTEQDVPHELHRRAMEVISAHATKSEIAAFTRKRKSIERMIDTKIHPLEDKLLEINAALMPLFDALDATRKEMVAVCVHPIDLLVHKGTHIECKFCSARLGVPATSLRTHGDE